MLLRHGDEIIYGQAIIHNHLLSTDPRGCHHLYAPILAAQGAPKSSRHGHALQAALDSMQWVLCTDTHTPCAPPVRGQNNLTSKANKASFDGHSFHELQMAAPYC